MRFFLFLIIILIIISLPLNELQATLSLREKIFFVEERIQLKGLPEDMASLQVWIPYPVVDDFQKISDFKIEGPFETRIITDKEYGNKILYLKAKPGVLIETLPEARLSFMVFRKEIGASFNSDEASKDRDRFLIADRLVPVNGEIRELAQKITQNAKNDLEKVRAIYDYIIEELTYSKDDPKICGIGDSLLTLQHKKGICTDYHSLFISLVRSLGIPAKFEVGFRIPDGKQEGKLNGYHCWAKFYLKDKGWIPVDISEADKHPERKDYFFGHIDENRIHLTSGRDISLKYARDSQPLNFLVYPYAELDGKQFMDMNVEMSFKEL